MVSWACRSCQHSAWFGGECEQGLKYAVGNDIIIAEQVITGEQLQSKWSTKYIMISVKKKIPHVPL